MYEFEDERWDETAGNDSHAGDWTPSCGGWLIQRLVSDQSEQPCDDQLCLQVGTGQWCGVPYATVFPAHSTAKVYAREFGYTVGRQVRLIYRRF